MKTILFSAAAVVGFAALTQAQTHTLNPQPPAPPAPPPVFQAPPAQVFAKPPAATQYVYEQRLMGSPQAPNPTPAPAPAPSPVPPTLVTPEQAQGIINRFKESYSKMGNPRLLVYVNRELINKSSGSEPSNRSEKPAGPGKSESGQSNTSASAPAGIASDKVRPKNPDPSEPSLADRQTTRDIERLFGRPLRMAGATLVDQRIAAQKDPDRSADHNTAADIDQARKDREALSKIADVALEILVSSRSITVPGANGDGNNTYMVPDIQATAIRLSDSKIIGQATASDIVGQGQAAARVAGTFGVREIAEATALSLMEDMVMFQ